MKRLLTFSAFLVLFACQQTDNKSTTNIIPDSVPIENPIETTFSKLDTTPKPTLFFTNFTNYLDSVGYIADTARAKIVSYRVLENSSIVFFNNRPFYKVSLINPDILSAKKSFEIQPFQDTTVDYNIFNKSTSTFAYYYRQNIKGSWIEDGIIEEWNFKSEKEAKKAFIELNKIKNMVYFNTFSFTLQTDNYLYIFHTRASAFDINMKKLFNIFKQRRK